MSLPLLITDPRQPPAGMAGWLSPSSAGPDQRQEAGVWGGRLGSGEAGLHSVLALLLLTARPVAQRVPESLPGGAGTSLEGVAEVRGTVQA